MIRKKEKAKFIALEGGEGAGKSTQARILTERLQANGIQTIQIHEPGTTSLRSKYDSVTSTGESSFWRISSESSAVERKGISRFSTSTPFSQVSTKGIGRYTLISEAR